MSFETLCLVWFAVMGLLLAGYAVLDGFDLGVGVLHPFVPRTDEERRISLNSIGPIWDGNEVWLVVFIGALFAMFPVAYASALSGFYTLFVALLFALIFRAVSIEFRSKVEHPRWRSLWDWAFFGGSALAAFLFGVAVGNVMRGVPLDERGDFTGTLGDQLNPYALLVGALSVALFTLHGALYLYLKTEGDLQQRVGRAVWRTFGVFLVLYLLVTGLTLVTVPHAARNFGRYPWVWVVPVLNVLAVANIPRAMSLRRPQYAFISSTCTIFALVFLLGVALFPYMLVGAPGLENSITIFDAAASRYTLSIGLLFVAIGMPLVLTYTVIVYWTFRGKVRLESHSS